MRRFLLTLLVVAAFAASACTTGARAKTSGEFGLQVGPPECAIVVKTPSLELGGDVSANPLGPIVDLISPKPTVPAVPDANVVAALAGLEEKAKAAEAKVKALEEKAAAPTATPEDKKARDDAAAALALGLAAKATADKAGTDALAAQAKADGIKPPVIPPLPTDFTVPGILTAAMGLGLWLLKRKAWKDAQEFASTAKADAVKAVNAAIVKFDGLPDDLPTEKVAEALKA